MNLLWGKVLKFLHFFPILSVRNRVYVQMLGLRIMVGKKVKDDGYGVN